MSTMYSAADIGRADVSKKNCRTKGKKRYVYAISKIFVCYTGVYVTKLLKCMNFSYDNRCHS